MQSARMASSSGWGNPNTIKKDFRRACAQQQCQAIARYLHQGTIRPFEVGRALHVACNQGHASVVDTLMRHSTRFSEEAWISDIDVNKAVCIALKRDHLFLAVTLLNWALNNPNRVRMSHPDVCCATQRTSLSKFQHCMLPRERGVSVSYRLKTLHDTRSMEPYAEYVVSYLFRLLLMEEGTEPLHTIFGDHKCSILFSYPQCAKALLSGGGDRLVPAGAVASAFKVQVMRRGKRLGETFFDRRDVTGASILTAKHTSWGWEAGVTTRGWRNRTRVSKWSVPISRRGGMAAARTARRRVVKH